ncbi:MAG: peptide-methionine (S)-S-oxide reductase [Nitrospirae bacterium]|nr:MAG: peptide-methionine (S)-S-oxide reductase [Nitrospirota bacterium]
MNDAAPTREQATLGGGCFWCLEAVYEHVQGVEQVESGYMGGHIVNPSYEAVCTGTTGHAEVVHIIFDSRVISYSELLEIFFAVHDPTTRNRQGYDVGPQYRSVIFYHSLDQKLAADAMITMLSRAGVFSNPIVTEVAPAGPFYRAEAYHQRYYFRNPSQPYCTFQIAPKLVKLRERFSARLKQSSQPS